MTVSIASLNNEAVSLLQNGSWDAAIVTLKAAVNSFMSSREQTERPPHIERNTDTSIQSVPVSLREQSNHHSCHFLFQCALVLSADESSLQLKSSVVLYNLALIHHLLGVRDCASKKLLGAKRLYLLAIDLVKNHNQEYGSKQALFLSLAIANNLGEMYLEHFHDAEEAKKCFVLVNETLRHVDMLEVDHDFMTEYVFFYLNAMVRGVGDTVAATAA